MSAPTPGPWKAAVDNLPLCILSTGDRIIASVYPSTDEGRANARMMAAALGMFEALKRIADEPCDHGPAPFCPREIARAAVAVAENA